MAIVFAAEIHFRGEFFYFSGYKLRISVLRLRFCLVVYVSVNSLRKSRTLLELLV